MTKIKPFTQAMDDARLYELDRAHGCYDEPEDLPDDERRQHPRRFVDDTDGKTYHREVIDDMPVLLPGSFHRTVITHKHSD
jgi:hypothetical protein